MSHSAETEPTVSSRDQAGGRTALLIIDMINCLDFDGGAALAPAARRAAEVIAQLRSQADQAKLPVIYVNDNFGAWHSEKLPDRAPVKLTITVTPELHHALSDYATIYNEAYGQSEPIAELMPHMLSAFLASDRGFAKARASLPESKLSDA